MITSEIRLQFWDDKFSTKRRFTRAELFDRFHLAFNEYPSIRTFRSDMKELRERGAPLSIQTFDKKNKHLGEDMKSYHFYTEDFSLVTKQSLADDDVQRIKEALSILKQFEHLPQFYDLGAVLFKLGHNVGKSTENKADSKDIIAFEQVPRLRGLARLKQLYKAIKQSEVLQLFYTEFDEPSLQTLLHPYFLKEYNNRWYVYGYDQNSNNIRPFALDRIERIEPIGHPYYPTKLDFNTLFDNRIGITSFGHEPVETVILRIKQPRAKYVITKPWHNTQTIIEETPQYVDFSFDLIINKELEAQVLAFGKDIEVVQPLDFREQIRQILTETIVQYQCDKNHL